MIVLERRAAWLMRAALRRGGDGAGRRADEMPVQIRLGPDGLQMHARDEEFAIIYNAVGPAGKGVFTFAAKHLAEFEGRTAEPVEIALLRPNLAGARWSEKGRSREIEIPLVEPETIPIPPDLPRKYAAMPAHFLTAIDQASDIAAREATKYVLNHIQLRGKAGAIVASDSRQLLQVGGFEFPFTEDLLIPRTGVFGLPPLQGADDVAIGKTRDHVAVRVGPWTFALTIDKQGRFPDATSIIPRPSQTATKLRLDADDAQRFLDSLTRRLKGPAAQELAVTIDLMEKPCLRFEMEGRISEVNLVNSEVRGKPVRMCMNLQQFLRALEMRFLEFEVRDPEKPILARDGERLYLSMPLSPTGALPPRPEAAAVPAEISPPATALAPVGEVTVPVLAGLPAERTPASRFDRFDVLGEAEGLREGLFKVAAHAGRILRFLREACTQQNVTQFVRSSLLALGERSNSGEHA